MGGVYGNSKDLTYAEHKTTAELDLFNVTLNDPGIANTSLTLGQQEFGFGDGFLIWDGYSDRAAVYSTPSRSLLGAKLTYGQQPLQLDVIAARTKDNFAQYDEYAVTYKGRSILYGANLHTQSDTNGKWDFGLFHRDDNSDLKNNTLALSIKGDYTLMSMSGLSLGGEVVKESGKTYMQNGTVSGTEQNRDALGGHLDATYAWLDVRYAPYVKLSYIYYSGDDPNTADNEAFDRLFAGWIDWGQWSVGSISSWSLNSTNERTPMLGVGMTPTPSTRLRVQFYDFSLNQAKLGSDSTQWSREANVMLDWYPTEKSFYGVAVNRALPGQAAIAYMGDNQGVWEFALWGGVSF